MTDRELLTLAAKAAGIEDYSRGILDGQPMLLVRDAQGSFYKWSPLTDDGDALKLLARLRLRLDYRDGFVGVWKVGPYLGQCPHDEENPHATAATRRAIVRAAAELGKALA